MRDPMSWALTLPVRAFGIPVKIHVLYFVVTIGLFLRQWTQADNVVSGYDIFLFTVVLLFGIIFLHELGHCFAARAVGGEAQEILIWPLGGLAFVEVPHHWRPHTFTAAAGPAANAAICLVLTAPLMAAGFLPNANPLANPYEMPLKNVRNDRVYTSQYGLRAYQSQPANSTVPAEFTRETATAINEAWAKKDFAEVNSRVEAAGFQRALAPTWVVWVGRAFWMSWLLFLVNLIPAYPLDGGQMMQGVIWARTDYRQGITVAAYCGAVASLLVSVYAFSGAPNESLLLGLAVFMFYSSYTRLRAQEADESAFGYDFSEGYTSLERDEPKPQPKKLPFFKRWLKARAVRKLQRENEERQREEERFDQLLGKVHTSGKGSLTDEERRFMERVSARYRNRS